MTNEEILALGRLSGQMEAVISAQDKQGETMGKIFERLDNLPCKENTSILKQLTTWQKDYDGTPVAVKVENVKGVWSLKAAIITSILGTGALTTLIIKLFELIK